jgi:hypothetical protein
MSATGSVDIGDDAGRRAGPGRARPPGRAQCRVGPAGMHAGAAGALIS